MTYEVIITPEAEQQIINLHGYITEKAGSVIADNYANALLDYLDGFSTFPHRGNKRDDIRQGMRVTHFRHRTIIAFAVMAIKSLSLAFTMEGKVMNLTFYSLYFH
ncbi:type II toxin-antitoxin system RelE/ParE family toxin [Escherichia coli]|nr:type II toxin-antitoxin system RelE/ParE family toxin [Escherichia coli]